MLNRLILWFSLFGMILAIHLWVQKARGFDQGCLGLETHTVEVASGGCADAGLEAASHLFGVSNAAWGYAFYFGLALLSFAKIVVPAAWARRLHGCGEVAVAVAFVYSGYLLYFQSFVVGAFCVLCLTSIGLVTLLLGLHIALRVQGGYQPVAEASRSGELGLAGGALFAAMGVLVGVLVFVNRLGTRPLDDGNGAIAMRRIVGEMLPVFIDPEKLAEMKACHFDGMAPRLDLAKFIGPEIPFIGKPDGVPVIVFFDPHCPHCQHFYPIYLKLIEKYRDRARFYILPRVLWDFSIPAVAALQLAEPSGKYFDLWKLEFDHPANQQLTVEGLSELYRKLGMDATNMAGRIDAVRSQVLAATKRAQAAGISGVPAIYIGGRKVFSMNYSVDCVGNLIDRSLSSAKPEGTQDQQN